MFPSTPVSFTPALASISESLLGLVLLGGLGSVVFVTLLLRGAEADLPMHPPPPKDVAFEEEPVIERMDLPRIPASVRRLDLPAEAVFDVLVGSDGKPRKISSVWCSHVSIQERVRRAIRRAGFFPGVTTEGLPASAWLRVVVDLDEEVWDSICLGPA